MKGYVGRIPTVKSIKNRMDANRLCNRLHLLAAFLLGDGPDKPGERQESHGLKILWQYK